MIRDLRVAAVHVYEGDEAVLTVSEKVLELARRFNVVEAAYDPWRWRSEALRAEQQGLRVVEFPQSHARMTVASEGLHSAGWRSAYGIPETVPSTATLAADVARVTGRGWRLDRSAHDTQIDAVVAVAMAVERAEHREPAARLLGWI